MLMDSSIAEVPTVISLQGYWDMKKKDIENTLMDRLLTFLLYTMILISIECRHSSILSLFISFILVINFTKE